MAVSNICSRFNRGNFPSIFAATITNNIDATKNLPNAAVINGKDWARNLPAIKVPPHNAATITSLNASKGVITERLAIFIFKEYIRRANASPNKKPPEGGFSCTTRHIVNTLYRTHTLQFLA